MASPSAAAQDYSAVVFHRWYLCAVQSFQIGDFNRGEGRGRACQDAILPISHFQVCETDSVMVPILWAESGRAVSKSSRPERAGAALWQTSMIRQAAVKKDQLVKMTNVCQAGIGAHPEASVAGRCLQFRGLLQVTVGGGGCGNFINVINHLQERACFSRTGFWTSGRPRNATGQFLASS